MNTRRFLLASFIVLLAFSMSFSGCSKPDKETEKTTAGRKRSYSQKSKKSHGNFLTAEKASAIAYEEAKKWHPDAFLWTMHPHITLHTDFNWGESGEASQWTVGFANPENDSTWYVYLKNGRVDYTKDIGNKRRIEVDKKYQLTRPLKSIPEIYRYIVKYGGPREYMPDSISYGLYTYFQKSEVMPNWGVAYRFPLSEKSYEVHIFLIDAYSGELIKNFYRTEKGQLTKEQMTVKTGNYVQKLDRPLTIIKFFSLINHGMPDDALSMTSRGFASGAHDKGFWKKAFSVPDSISLKYLPSPSKGSNDVYDVTFEVDGGPDIGQYGWVKGDNKRRVRLERSRDKWLISEIAPRN